MYHVLVVLPQVSGRYLPAMGLSEPFPSARKAEATLRKYGWTKIPTPRNKPREYKKGEQKAVILAQITHPAMYE